MRIKHVIQKTLLSAALCAILPATSAHAAVPGLINYQGRLTDSNGDPVTGSKTLAVAIYDAATGGTLRYSENIGAVPLDDRGIYSFQFGSAGTSVATRSETLATTDGTLTVFNGTLSATAIPGSVSLSDGTFTWSQSAGSSAPANFIGSFVGASGIASAIYIQGEPPAGTAIEVSFNYEEAGITGALSSGSSHWLELTVDGAVQATRERVLAVPFAQVAGKSTEANFLAERQNVRVFLRNGFTNGSTTYASTLRVFIRAATYPLIDAQFIVPGTWKRISKLEITGRRIATLSHNNTDLSAVNVKLRKWDPQQNISSVIKEFNVYDASVNLPRRSWHDFSYTLPWDVQFSEDTQYFLEFQGGGQGNSRSEYKTIHATVDLLQR